MKTVLSFFTLVFTSLLLAAPLHADSLESPVDMLKRTSDEVIAVLKEKREQIEKQPELVYELVDQYILPHLDEVTMAKLALGKTWRKASREEKHQFVDAFRTLLVRTYSKSLQEFRDQQINFFPAEAKNGKAVVKSEVIQPGGPKIPVSYRMRVKDNAWKVYDISIEGVSLVTSYRGTFTQEFRKGGMAGLLRMLEEKNGAAGARADAAQGQG